VKIVIQCAAKKHTQAGSMKTEEGKTVMFVAASELVDAQNEYFYQTPDTKDKDGLSWREKLLEYNKTGTNPFNLYPAYKLYVNSVYEDLVVKYGGENVYILSAGWGLIKADFLIPKYDITFSARADKYKKRRKLDNFEDFCFLSTKIKEDLLFFGGRDYLPLFTRLTANYQGRKVVFYNSKNPPEIKNCNLIRFNTTIRTNWHYACVKAFVNGQINI